MRGLRFGLRTAPPPAARAKPLDGYLPPDPVRNKQPLQHAAVAGRFLRRNLKRHGLKPPAWAGPDGKGAGALGQTAEPPALPAEHLDLADVSVGVRIKLDPRLAGAASRRHIDHAGGAANTEGRGRRRDLHVAGLGHQARHEGGGAQRDIERGGVGVAAFLIDEFADDDAGIGGEAEGRLVVEGDAERGIGAGLKRIVLEDRVVDLQRDGCGGIGAAHRRAALQGGDLTDLIGGGRV